MPTVFDRTTKNPETCEDLTPEIPIVQRPWLTGSDGLLQRDPVSMLIWMYNGITGTWNLVEQSTNVNFTFVVNQSIGDDTANGDSVAPLLTVQEAFDRLPSKIQHDVTVNVNNGTYNEALILSHLEISSDVSFNVNGDSQITVTPTTGPATDIAVLTGSLWDITAAPAPAWTPNDFIGKFALFTAGTHAGYVVPIVANDVNSIRLASIPFLGAYDNTDIFDIVENTTIIQSTTPVRATLTLDNTVSRETGLNFNYFDFYGDTAAALTIRLRTGKTDVNFDHCYIKNAILPFSEGSAISFTWSSMNIWQNGGFFGGSQPPSGNFYRASYCAFLTNFHAFDCYSDRWLMYGVLWIPNNPTKGAIYNQNAILDVNGDFTRFDGLHPNGRNFALLVYGDSAIYNITFFGSELMNSDTGGIIPVSGVDRIMSGVVSLSEVDVYDNNGDGLDLRGSVSVNLTDAVTSSPNGGWGLKLRKGAVVYASGVNSISGFSGDINMSDINQIDWADSPATDLIELTRVNGSPPT